jgi:hypothetical protein
MHRMNEQKDDLYDVFIYCIKFWNMTPLDIELKVFATFSWRTI